MFRPGDDLGRYRVVKTIGLGGMGIVYQGRDTVLGRDVAIKAMTGAVASDDKMRQRFLQELENAPRVVHPFVTTVFDVVDRPEGPLLVMELVEGLRFDHFCEEKQPPLPVVARFGAEVAEALTAIHAVGMAHRDLKPGNVLVTPDGHPKVMDFGVALRLPGFDRTDLATSAEGERHTDSGAVVGTIAYMSPEQLRGEEPDERSDLFALGIMLFEGVTGHHPFPGDTSAEIAGSILHELPGTVEDRHKLHECGTLGTTILRLLDKNPKERLGSAREAASLLHQATAHWSSPGLPARRRTFRAIGGSVLVALALGGVIYGLREWLFGPESSTSGAIGGTVRPAVAIIPFESASGGPGAGTGLMVADLLAAQLGESARLRPVATDRIAECLEALPAGTAASARRARLVQATPATWIVSGTLYSEGDEILASIAVFARDSSDPVTSFQVRAKRPSDLSTKAFQRLQETTGAEDLASFLPRRKAPAFPSDPEAAELLRRARDAARHFDFARGTELLDEALRRDANFLDAQILLADLLNREGYERRAGQVADRAIALAKSAGLPDDARQSLQARAVKTRRGGGPDYVATLRQLAARYPDEPQVLRDLAWAIRRKEPDEAAKLVTTAVELDPSDGGNYLAKARVLIELKRVQDAFLAIDQAEAMFKSFGAPASLGDVAKARSYAYLQAAEYDAAREAMHRARSIFESTQRPIAALVATSEEGDMELRRYRIDDAQRLFAQALPGLKAAGHYSRVVNALSGLGAALMSNGRNAESESKFVEAADLARTVDNSVMVALPLVNLTSLYTQTGRYREAKALSAELLGAAPGEIPEGFRCSATLTGAMAEAGLGHLDDAIAALQRHVGSNLANCGPARIASAAAMESWYEFQTGATSAALASLDRAITLIDGPDPPADLAFYLAERARVQARLGRLDAAKVDLTRAESIAGNPKGRGMTLDADLVLARASIAVARGDLASALRAAQPHKDGSGDVHAALVLLRGEVLVAAKRTAEARRWLGTWASRGVWSGTDRRHLRYLEALVSLAEGRRAGALTEARAILDEPGAGESRFLTAKLADLAARAEPDSAAKKDFLGQRDTVVSTLLDMAPADARAWLAAHWGEPTTQPTPPTP